MSDHVKVEVTPDETSTPAENPNAPPAPPVEQVADRPGWLPEKFEKPEDLAAAYDSLQKKLGAPKEEVKPEIPQEQAPAISEDFLAPFTSEYAEKGELSDASFEQLAKHGLSREVVENYIDGVRSKVAREESAIFDTVGGEDNFKKMAEWAGANMDETRINTLNEMLTKGGEQAKMAAQAMQQEYVAANGSPPQLLDTSAAPAGGTAYRSLAEMMKDMSDPRYNDDPAFRQSVADKLGRSQVLQ